MSTPPSSQEWFELGDETAASDVHAQAASQVIGAATTFISQLAQPRQATCLRSALAIACHAATLFQPRFAHAAELRWCGPDGQPAPAVAFPKDFIDRRSVVAWSLYRMTVATPVDEPIFSAQARVTLFDSLLAAFRNFDKPAATLVSNEASVAKLEESHVPKPVQQELERATEPMVYVVMLEPTGFDDVILYTALFNFSRAFSAFQTGPWQSLKRGLGRAQPLCDSLVLSLAETRVVQRAALAAIESAWEASYQQPIATIQPTLLDILSQALSGIKR